MHGVGIVDERPSTGPDLALGRSARSWEALLETLPVGVYVCDRHGALERYNNRAAELWGRAPDTGDPETRYCGAFRAFDLSGRPLAPTDSPMSEVLRTGVAVKDREVVVERPDGSRIHVLANVEPLFDEDGSLAGGVSCFQDISEQKRTEQQLAARERWHRDLLDALPAAIYTTDAEGRITFFNQAAAEFSGRQPVLGSDAWCVTWKLYSPDGAPMAHDSCPMAVTLRENRQVRGAEAVAERPDGKRTPFLPFPTPIQDADGNLIGAVNMLVDISERKDAEDSQRVMAAELNHRVKNTLASVQSLAVHSLSGDGDPKTMREAFEARLVALSKVHNQLAENHWSWADLGTIVRDALAPFPQAAYEPLRGPQVSLAAASAVALAMVLNELATNAGRYGALATSEGRLALCWSVDERETGRVLVLDWRESGGAPVVKPMRRGFGARFVERAVQCELDGRITLDFAPEGLFCRIEAPLQTGLKAGAGPLGTPTP